jgi:dUTP pyrophosphatase
MEIIIIDKRITPDMVGYKTPGAGAMDIYAAVSEALYVYPGEVYRIPTGIKYWLYDVRTVGLISLRSGSNGSLVCQNAPGILDSDYQGELLVKVRNVGDAPVRIAPLERFAQLTIIPVVRPLVSIVEEFSYITERGENGFGSTGNQ